MSGQPGQNTRPYTWLPPSSLGMDAWMTSQLNIDLIRKLRTSLMCLAYFYAVHGCLCSQARADVRSTGAWIECPYCTNRCWSVDVMQRAPITLILLVVNSANTKLCIKTPWNNWNPGKWVLIWEYWARDNSNEYQNNRVWRVFRFSLSFCTLGESSLSSVRASSFHSIYSSDKASHLQPMTTFVSVHRTYGLTHW